MPRVPAVGAGAAALGDGRGPALAVGRPEPGRGGPRRRGRRSARGSRAAEAAGALPAEPDSRCQRRGIGAAAATSPPSSRCRRTQFQQQLTELTGQIERVELKVNDIAAQLERMQKDTEYRLGALEGGGAPMPPPTVRRGAPRPACRCRAAGGQQVQGGQSAGQTSAGDPAAVQWPARGPRHPVDVAGGQPAAGAGRRGRGRRRAGRPAGRDAGRRRGAAGRHPARAVRIRHQPDPARPVRSGGDRAQVLHPAAPEGRA